MQSNTVLQIGVVLSMSLFLAPSSSDSCRLLKTFPDEFKNDETSVASLVVVTFSNSKAFLRLFALEFENPVPDHPPMSWCGYEGFDDDYHYASALASPDEVYRIRRTLIEDDDIVKVLVPREAKARKERRLGTSASLPTGVLNGYFLHRSNELDRSLIHRVGALVRQDDTAK